MKKETKYLVIKIIIFVTMCLITSGVLNAFEPTVTTKLAINQLNGGDAGFAAFNAYTQVKSYIEYGYALIFLLLFYKNIINGIRIIIAKFTKTETETEIKTEEKKEN